MTATEKISSMMNDASCCCLNQIIIYCLIDQAPYQPGYFGWLLTLLNVEQD